MMITSGSQLINAVFFLTVLVTVVIQPLHACTTPKPNLRAIKSSAKLPALKYLLSPIYDGDDYIYLMDGYDTYFDTSVGVISRYSISTDEIVSVAHNSVYNLKWGSAFMDFEQNLTYYLSGLDTGGRIMKVDLNTNNWTIIADWTVEWRAARILIDDNTGYIMGGNYYNSVNKFHIKTAMSTTLSDLPAPFGGSVLSGVHTGNDSIYLFGCPWGTCDKVGKYSIEIDYVDVLQLDTGYTSGDLSTVWTGEEIYIFGNVQNYTSPNVWTYNVETNLIAPVTIDDFPGEEDQQMFFTDAVYKQDNGLRSHLLILTFSLVVIQPLDTCTTPKPNLRAIKSSAKLPALKYLLNPIYDGDDYIYLMDGFDGYFNASVAVISRWELRLWIFYFEGEEGQQMGFTDAVYVKKMNRIYAFGGILEGVPIDDIWSIDLN
ncbi:Kelch-like protein 12 [Folsomia candida]|uniref:Kelch-like protein 12 n=1 Tax=Folsomia candida TaxID=158441 RepID=A0A226ED88_FOLCA|nr:Kelch-like protein 12 [Folsomia candida]